MEINMDFEKAVKERHSVRKYTDRKIEGEVLSSLQDEIDASNNESGLRMELVLNEENAFGKSHYGNFEGCRNYIVIIGNKKLSDIDEKAGYYGERIVIKAQELGLNTCWVALTYNKSHIPCSLADNEKIVIVIAIGYGVNSGTPRKSKNFDAVSKTKNAPEWYRRGVEFALLAPTAINQQKFKFELVGEAAVSAKVAGIGMCTKIDLGIVKYHFEIGAGKDNFCWA